MSARELKVVAIKVNHKFASVDDARKLMNSLNEFVRYTCQQKANFCQGIIAISGVKSASINRIVTEIEEKRGRPKLT